MRAKKAQGHWGQLTAALLVVIVLVVVIIIFATKTGESSKDISRCQGIPGSGQTGKCVASEEDCITSGGRVLGSFGSDCPDDRPICCIK